MTRAQLVNNTRFPEANVRAVEEAMDKAGYLNPYLRVAVLSTIAKESSFKPKSEYSYKNTSNSRIRQLFGKYLKAYNETQLTKLKNNDVAFYGKIYGGRMGNNKASDGYNYRGRGFNQLTGKSSYAKYGKMAGHDIVKNPDLLNRVDVASDILIAYMNNRLKNIPKNDSRFPVTELNSFTDQDTATRTVVNANHGWTRDVRKSHPETLEKAKNYQSIFQYPKELFTKFHSGGIDELKKSVGGGGLGGYLQRNWMPLTIIGVSLAVGGFFLIRHLRNK
jgi:predicted chitinase